MWMRILVRTCLTIALSFLVLVCEVSAYSDLMAASREGRLEDVKRLLSQGVDVNAAEENGWTALTYAALSGHPSVAKVLLDNGASAKGETGRMALGVAIDHGHTEIVRILLDKGVDVNTKIKYHDWPPLMQAIMADVSPKARVEIVTLLIEKGADVNSNKGRYGETALIIATRSGYGEIIKILKAHGAKQ